MAELAHLQRRGTAPATTLPSTLYSLARRVERLVPSARCPDRFHEDKSEIVAELHRLAREVRYG